MRTWSTTGGWIDRLKLFPETAAVERGELTVSGILGTQLAEEFGTPLVVYCERTVLAAARAYVEAAPGALVLYGVKAFPNVALLQLLAAEGLGADVSTLGELAYALRAGVPGNRIVVHGNNKSDEELQAAAAAEARFVVLDAQDEVALAAAADVRRVLVRVTPGIEADTHPAIRTAHHGSKFGLPPEPGRALVGRAGLPLSRVDGVRPAAETTAYVAIDGGMSDNPRPQLYGARYSALLANRADEKPEGAYTVCGKHCESGDVLIESAP